MAAYYVEDGYVTNGYIQTGVEVIWGTHTIFIPKIAMIEVQTTPTEIWQLDIPTFKATLGGLLDDEAGMANPDIFVHNPSVSVGGAVLSKVVEILEPYTVTFEDGQYAVNLVGANSNIGDRVNVNQVSVRSANSAGLQDLNSLQAASFGDGAVAISQTKGVLGTTYPIGTKGVPSNNWTDAKAILESKNMSKVLILDNATADDGDDLSNISIMGTNPMLSTLTIAPLADTYGAYIQEVYFSGYLDGGSILRNCVLGEVQYFNGYIDTCALTTQTIFINGAAVLMNCVIGADVVNIPKIDLTNATSLSIRNFDGHIKLVNCTNPIHIDISITGVVTIDSSVTNGIIEVHGDGDIEHTQMGTEVIIDKTSGGGGTISEGDIHLALDSYTNKNTFKADITDITDNLLGSWEILNNQLIMYREGGTELRRFNLLNKAGNPSETTVYKREVI